jgi:hypothetical protein
MADINQLITNFYDQAVGRDFSRDINFRVLNIEPGPAAPDVDFAETDLVYAKGGTVPGRDIQNVTAKYMGLNFNLPGVATYPGSEGYELEFYCDRASELRQKFEQWSRALFDDASSTGNYNTPSKESYIILAQLNPDMTVIETGKYKLIGVSIRKVGPLQYAVADGTGAPVSFKASMSYHYYENID